MTEESKKPFSEDNQEGLLMKMRLVYCPFCGNTQETDLSNPKCGNCYHSMITVLRKPETK